MASKAVEKLIKNYSQETDQSYRTLLNKYEKTPVHDKGKFLKNLRKEIHNINITKKQEINNLENKKISTLWYKNILKRAAAAGNTKLKTGLFYHYTYKSFYYPDLLAFYDTKPLIFLFDKFRSKGKLYLLGINFHWLPKISRFEILNKMKRRSPEAFDIDERNFKINKEGWFVDGKKFKITKDYKDGTLSIRSENRNFRIKKSKLVKISYFDTLTIQKPIKFTYSDIKKYAKSYVIIRKYIRGNIKKKIINIHANEIFNVVSLPSEKFVGITPEKAWQYSKMKANKHREKKKKK